MSEEIIPEKWSAITWTNGWYEASNHGRIRSWKNNHGLRRKIPMVLKESVLPNGYYRATLHIDGKRNYVLVHRVVAEAFYGKDDQGRDVAHNDGDKSNNHLTNLRYATKKENEADKIVHGTALYGQRHNMAKMTNESVMNARKMLEEGWTRTFIAKLFGVSRTTIGRINSGKTWCRLA